MTSSNVVQAILDVFGDISEWIILQLSNITDIFWVQTGDSYSLTFLGVLAIIALGISVIFLLMRVIQNFLHFRG